MRRTGDNRHAPGAGRLQPEAAAAASPPTVHQAVATGQEAVRQAVEATQCAGCRQQLKTALRRALLGSMWEGQHAGRAAEELLDIGTPVFLWCIAQCVSVGSSHAPSELLQLLPNCLAPPQLIAQLGNLSSSSRREGQAGQHALAVGGSSG